MKEVEGGEVRQEGDRLAGSYVNFYLPNGVIVIIIWDLTKISSLMN